MNWFRRKKDRELDEEIQADLAMTAQERIEAGESPESAWAAARREFGNVTLAKEATRETWAWGSLERFGQEIRYAFRQHRRNPAFTVILVLILALGIGANTAVFNLVNSVILKNLPVYEPQRLVLFTKPSFSYPIFQEVRTRGDIFDGFFAWDVQDMNVEWNGELQTTQVLVASGELYSTLGVQALRGRLFGPQDDVASGGMQGPVAVISHASWERRFAQDPGVIGKTIRIERVPFTVIGVTPPEFFGVAVGLAPEVTIPVTMTASLKPQNAGILIAPHDSWLHLMGRLKAGISIQQADAAVQVFWPRVMEATTNPAMPADRRARYLSRTTELASAQTGHSRIRNAFTQPLWVLLALASLLLLITCATAANLLLAKGASRRREIAVRIALGASRFRLVRQLLTEGILLAALGGLLGLLFASWGSDALVRMLSTSNQTIAVDLRPDWRVLAFTMFLALATAVLFTIAPAWRGARVHPAPALKETPRAPGHQRGRLGKSLVVAQVALSMMLLAGAALFARSLGLILSTDGGFDRKNVLVVSADPIVAGYEGPRLVSFYSELLERMRALPGVRSASLSWVPPVSNNLGAWTQSVSIDGAPPQLDEASKTYFNAISPEYFATLGTQLLQGRDFGPEDNESGPGTVIVNESLARAYFPGQSPLGRRISIGRGASRQNLEIVGIVEDAKYQFLQEPNRRIAYLPYLQLPEFVGGSNLVAELRTNVPAGTLSGSVRREIRAMDSGIPVKLETLEDRIRESLVTERVIAVISGFLGAVALLLASAGLHGLMSYTVSRRTNEIGIRMALGAPKGAVLRMVLRESTLLAALGVAMGLAGSVALGRLIASLLYGLKPTDGIALASSAAVMLAVALAAASIPACKAARVDPVVALRAE